MNVLLEKLQKIQNPAQKSRSPVPFIAAMLAVEIGIHLRILFFFYVILCPNTRVIAGTLLRIAQNSVSCFNLCQLLGRIFHFRRTQLSYAFALNVFYLLLACLGINSQINVVIGLGHFFKNPEPRVLCG
jgi:hypothetical protein